MGAWNLPPAMHRLSYMTAGVAILSAVLTLRYGTGWPLLARWALAYTAAVGATVAVLASTRRSAFVCRRFFCKDPVTGRIPWYCVLLLWPYHLVVQLVCIGYRSSAVGENIHDQIAEHLFLGGWPLNTSMLPSRNTALLDCSNELLRWVKTPAYRPLLIFESWGPEPADLQAAVEWALGQQEQGRDVFVHCTHGHGRSAVTAAAILMAMGQAESVDEAMAKIVVARPGVKPNLRQVGMLREWAARYGPAGAASSQATVAAAPLGAGKGTAAGAVDGAAAAAAAKRED